MSQALAVMPPIRCFSCWKPIGHLWLRWQEMRRARGNEPGVVTEILHELGLTRVCCCRMLLTHTEPVAAPQAGRFMRPAMHMRNQ
jgi:DNA-directed RNA polymerase subunit N